MSSDPIRLPWLAGWKGEHNQDLDTDAMASSMTPTMAMEEEANPYDETDHSDTEADQPAMSTSTTSMSVERSSAHGDTPADQGGSSENVTPVSAGKCRGGHASSSPVHTPADGQAERDSTSPSTGESDPTMSTNSSPEPSQESAPSRGASPPSPARYDSNDIPVEELKVARWARKDSTYMASPEANAWQVTVAADKQLGINAKIRTTDEFKQKILAEYPLSSQQDVFVTGARRSGFVNGRCLFNLSLTIQTCVGEARPATLYRAIHDEMPYDGIGARGLELTTTNGLFFQRYLQNHFATQSRQPSPFLSTTSRRNAALDHAYSFEAKRKARKLKSTTGVKLLEISATGKYWDHHVSRLWEVRHILGKLQLMHKNFHRSEYLVENVIPKEHVIRVYDLSNAADRKALDPKGRRESQFYKSQMQREESQRELAEANSAKKRKSEEEHGASCKKPRTQGTTKYNSVISQGSKKRTLTSG